MLLARIEVPFRLRWRPLPFITTECVTKVALTANDNERIIIPGDPEHWTLALGHWRARHPDLYNVDIDTKKLFEKGSLMNLAYNAI